MRDGIIEYDRHTVQTVRFFLTVHRILLPHSLLSLRFREAFSSPQMYEARRCVVQRRRVTRVLEDDARHLRGNVVFRGKLRIVRGGRDRGRGH